MEYPIKYKIFILSLIKLACIRVNGWACSTHEGQYSAYKSVVRKSEGKRPLERLRRRGKYNIEIYLENIGVWIELIWFKRLFLTL
jgi:hypothetical protein